MNNEKRELTEEELLEQELSDLENQRNMDKESEVSKLPDVKSKKPLIIGIVVSVIILCVIGGYFLLNNTKEEPKEEKTKVVEKEEKTKVDTNDSCTLSSICTGKNIDIYGYKFSETYGPELLGKADDTPELNIKFTIQNNTSDEYNIDEKDFTLLLGSKEIKSGYIPLNIMGIESNRYKEFTIAFSELIDSNSITGLKFTGNGEDLLISLDGKEITTAMKSKEKYDANKKADDEKYKKDARLVDLLNYYQAPNDQLTELPERYTDDFLEAISAASGAATTDSMTRSIVTMDRALELYNNDLNSLNYDVLAKIEKDCEKEGLLVPKTDRNVILENRKMLDIAQETKYCDGTDPNSECFGMGIKPDSYCETEYDENTGECLDNR